MTELGFKAPNNCIYTLLAKLPLQILHIMNKYEIVPAKQAGVWNVHDSEPRRCIMFFTCVVNFCHKAPSLTGCKFETRTEAVGPLR